MKTTAVALVAALIVSTALLAQTTATPDVLLKAAMQKEQIDSDLPGAIAAYKAVVEKFPKSPEAAKALLQLGGIFVSAGRPEGLENYQRIVERFPDQVAVVNEARRRIAAMSIQTIRPTQVQLPIPPNVFGSFRSRVSPDGQSISFVSDSIQFKGDGNLGVWNLTTGATRLVTKSSGYQEGYARESAWSPDGRTLAFVWFDAVARRYEVRTVPSTGGAMRTLYSAANGLVNVFSWSPNGHEIAVAVQSDATNPSRYQLALASTQSKSLRVVKAFDGVRRPDHAVFSPDGRFLAYDYPPVESSPSRDVFLLEIETGAVTPLVSDPGSSDEVLGWFPGTDHVVYTCDWRGTREARAVQIRQGKPFLDPFPIKRDVGSITSLGFSRDGRFFALKSVGLPDVLTAPMDPATVMPAGGVSTLPPAASVGRGHATWSPDGKRIAYFEQLVGTDWTLAVLDMATGSKRLLPARVREPERPTWQPDGRAVAFHAWDLQDQGGQYRVNLDTGHLDRMTSGHTGAFSPDGQFFFHVAPGPSIRKIKLADGTSESIYQGPRNAMALSPDGRHIAVFDVGVRDVRPSSISIVSSAGGARRKILEGFMEDVLDNEIAWSHNSQFVFFVTTEPRDIWRVSIEGGSPERLNLNTGAKHLSISPDGRQLLISVNGDISEIWMWENLLPKAGPQKDLRTLR